MTPDVDVAVLGAGIAGLVAARILNDTGLRVRLLEARTRVGGRIHTDHDFASVPIERGAEFVHGDAVATWRYLDRLGLATRRSLRTRHLRLVQGEQLHHPLWLLTRPAFFQLLLALPELMVGRRRDESVAAFLRRRRIRDPAGWQLADTLANSACASAEDLSLADVLRMYSSQQSSGGDFRIEQGYQALPAHLARGLDVHYGVPVTRVRWNDQGVDIEAGQRLRARAALITLPLGVLQGGQVLFEPPLPAAKQAALAALRMHPAIKVLCRYREPVGPRDVRVLAGDDVLPLIWRAPSPAPVWTAFLTGPRARHAPDGEQVAHRVSRLLGGDALDALRDVEVVDWGRDPWARGGYSAVPPGEAHARVVLARTVGPLLFAGEATAADGEAGTVSGAISSGERAATQLLATFAALRS